MAAVELRVDADEVQNSSEFSIDPIQDCLDMSEARGTMFTGVRRVCGAS